MDREALNSLRIDREAADAGAARRRRPVLIAAGLLVLLLAAAAIYWTFGDSPIVVQTALARAESVTGNRTPAVLNASGYVVARRMATVSSKITGQLTEVRVEEGMTVDEGQLLARLDDDIAQARLSLAESQLQTARRRVAQVQVDLAQARRERNRVRSLREQDLVSQAALDQAEAAAASLEAQLSVARSQVQTARDNVALSRRQLEETVVRAPFDGVVTIKNAQPGEIVSPVSAGGGFTRTGIATIVDMDSLEIEVDVNESYINRVFEGQRVEAVLDAYPDWRIPAKVISIVPTADRQSATVQVRVAFDELDPRILPEMGVQVWFLEQRSPQPQAAQGRQVWVPARALHQANGESYVYLVQDGAAERRVVQAGIQRANEVAIGAGLSGGERIIVQSQQPLQDGAAVTEGET